MTDFLIEWASAITVMVLESGPYLLLGLIVAGLLKALMPRSGVVKYLGRDDLKSVTIATLVGAPLPLCSCSVIPTAIELRRKGASKGATTAFLISTPETGVDSIGITWALIDPIMAIVRPIAAILTSVGAGSIVNAFERRGWLPGGEKVATTNETESCAVGATGEAAPGAEPPRIHDHTNDHDHDHDHGDHAGHSHDLPFDDAAPPRPRRSPFAVIAEATRYGFGPLLADLTPWLILGFAISGLIVVALPDTFFGETIPDGWIAMLIVLLVAPFMYICASASTPIAAALIAKGLDPGAALVLILVGEATSAATMFVVNKLLGTRAIFVYVGTILLGALIGGLAIDRIYEVLAIDLRSIVAQGTEVSAGIVDYVCGAVLAVGILAHAWRESSLRRFENWLASIGVVPSARFARVIAVGLLLIGWLSSSYSVVLPGETGFVTRFGRVVETVEGPGHVFHAPYPISRLETVSTEFVHRVKIGADEGEPEARSLAVFGEIEPAGSEIECVTSDEKLLLISYSVHFRIADPRRVRFGIGDPSQLVANASAAALRRTVSRHKMDEHLVERREPLEIETTGYLAELLSGMNAGLEVIDVNFDYIHAPAQVHFAYRDVASAIEDMETSVKNGEFYEIDQMALARADDERIVQDAEGNRAKALAAADHVIARFRELASLAPEYAGSVRRQLVLESARRAYRDLNVIARLAANVSITPIYQSSASGSDGEAARSAAESEH